MAVCIVVLSTLALTSRLHTQDEDEAAKWVEHTHIVIENLLLIGEAVATAESGVRGYASTHLPNELPDIDRGLAEAGSAFDQVRWLTQDNVSQQHRLDRLVEPFHRRLQFLRERLGALQAGRPDPGITPEVLSLSNLIRRSLKEMVDAEMLLLGPRNSRRTAEAARVQRTSLLAILTSIAIIAAATILLMRETDRGLRVGREIALKNQLLDSIIEGTTDAIYVKDLNGRYVLMNTAGSRLYDLTPAEMVGKNVLELMPFETGTEVMKRDQDVMHSGIARTGEETAVIRGEARTFLTTKGPQRDADKRVIGLIGISRDITEHRRLEKGRLEEVSLHLNMGELLQACRTLDEAYQVIGQLAPRFFPDEPGALFVFHASRDHLEAQVTWGLGMATGQTFAPDDCWCLRFGQPHYMEAIGVGMSCKHYPPELFGATLCLPLLAYGEILGILHLRASTSMDEPFRKRAGVLVAQIAMAIANLQLREKLRNQSIRDPLTGLFNRRYTEETLGREIYQANRQRTSLGVLAIDVDHFKRFNDSFGHEAGDKVLREIGKFLTDNTRGGDVASRMGGEELMVLMPGALLTHARAKAEQLRGGVSRLAVYHLNAPLGPVTISIGVATFPQHGRLPEELLRRADAALYRAKHQGRNRVEVAEGAEAEVEVEDHTAHGPTVPIV
jgi:diguanylate cyclase (GGDEF)-like protein/PAS domain S-box-containing protein